MTKQRAGMWAVVLGCSIVATSGAAAMAQTSAQPVKDDLFAGTEKFAKGATSVTQIDMDPDSLHEVEGKNGPRARGTVLEVVHAYTYDQPGMYKIEDVEAFRKKLDSGDWHCSVHIRQMKTGESTDVCNKHRTDKLREEAVITVSPRSLTFIHTIRRDTSRAAAGVPAVPLPMRLTDSGMQAEMSIARAEVRAQMAVIGPQLQAQLAGMKDFKGPNPSEMLRLREQMKNFKGPDPAEMQRLRDQLDGLSEKKSEDGKTPPQ